jgi:hypothetical protein
VLTFSLATIVGCGFSLQPDPAKTVDIMVSGIEGSEAREAVQEKMKDLRDSLGLSTSTSLSSISSGDTMTVSISLVTNVDVYAEKIDFGTVTNVEGRTIKVDSVP